MVHRILVVDDEPHIRDVICFALERAGMEVASARNGREALAAAGRGRLDLVVLDIGMPDIDGLEVCRGIRKTSNLPVLFLSARDDEIDRIVGLELGGDDYVTKPFSPRELVARVNAILRRTRYPGNDVPDAIERGTVRLDRTAHQVTAAGVELFLTAMEFAILEALMARPAMTLSRGQLIDAAYGPSTHVADRTVDSHIRNIRAKFAATGEPGIIETVHGIGFRLGLAADRGS